MKTIAQTAVAVAALGAWPEPQAAIVPSIPPAPARTQLTRHNLCENQALIYRDNPKAYGGCELERIVPCFEPATATRWSRRGTDQATQQRYCQAHAAGLDAYRAYLNERVDVAYAARGEDPLDHHHGDRVATPDGPGTVVGLPSAAWSDTYAVGLDSRRRGDRPSQYYADQLTPAA